MQTLFQQSHMPSRTRCVCTTNPFIHQIYANHNLVAQAVTVLQDGTVGRIYKSAPTVFINYMAHSGSICAMAVLFQQSHMPSRTRCVCTTDPFIHQIYANHNLVAQAVGFMQVHPYNFNSYVIHRAS